MQSTSVPPCVPRHRLHLGCRYILIYLRRTNGTNYVPARNGQRFVSTGAKPVTSRRHTKRFRTPRFRDPIETNVSRTRSTGSHKLTLIGACRTDGAPAKRASTSLARRRPLRPFKMCGSRCVIRGAFVFFIFSSLFLLSLFFFFILLFRFRRATRYAL